MASHEDLRHGVFLLPDARTSATITTITTYLRAQFGIVSAGRSPPHITLAGSLPLAVGEAELVEAVREAARRHDPVAVTNAGSKLLWGSVLAFDVHEDGCGRPNAPLVDLAADVMDVVRSVVRHGGRGLPADLHERADWHGHLSLASHELLDRADLRDEVEQFVRQLEEPYPVHFSASRLAVVRLHHRDWADGWWADFRWELVCTVALGKGPTA